MKITLSKSQWELIGKTAGWIKTANKTLTSEPLMKEEITAALVTQAKKELLELAENNPLVPLSEYDVKNIIKKYKIPFGKQTIDLYRLIDQSYTDMQSSEKQYATYKKHDKFNWKEVNENVFGKQPLNYVANIK